MLPQLTGQQLADLLVYVRSVQGVPRRNGVFQASSAEAGRRIVRIKGMLRLPRRGDAFLRDRPPRRNDYGYRGGHVESRARHESEKSGFRARPDAAIAAYIWSRRTMESEGSPSAGYKVFSCEEVHGLPRRSRPAGRRRSTNGSQYFSAATMVSALTRHGPAMLDRMREKHLAWPHFSAEEMADLIAYLNTRSSRNGR